MPLREVARALGLAGLLLSCGACPNGQEPTTAGEPPETTTGPPTTGPTTATPTTVEPTAGDQPPVAVIAADAVEGAAPLRVKFSGALSSDDEGPVSAWAWTFGDGEAADGAMVEHVYAAPATYVAALTVTDSAGQQGTSERAIAVDASCPAYASAGSVGTLTPPEIVEASGLAASGVAPGVVWTHNDSEDDPHLYAFAVADARYLGRYALQGASVYDWEDMAVGPGVKPGPHLYVGDIGDNNAERAKITVYRVAEPAVDPAQEPVLASLSGVEALEFTYPGGQAHDAETLLLDPVRGDLCVATKRGDGQSEIYCATAPLTAGLRTLELEATVAFGGLTTGGSVSLDGRLVAIRSYLDARLWRRPEGAPLWDAFTGEACVLALAIEIQGEAIAWLPGSLEYLSVSEGAAPALRRYARQ